MIKFIDELTLAQVSWLTILLYFLHYTEEGPRLVRWLNLQSDMKGLTYTQKKLNLENLLYIIFTIAGVILINLYPRNVFLQAMPCSVSFAFLCNTWFHCSATWKTDIYSPGTITSAMFGPLVFFLHMAKAWDGGAFTLTFAIITLALGFGIFPLFLILTHKVILRDDRGPSWLDWFPVAMRKSGASTPPERA